MAEPAKSAASRLRGARLETRLTAAQKALVERAAALQGRTVTDFVLSSVQDVARRAIEEHQRLELSTRDAEAFVTALLEPQPAAYRPRGWTSGGFPSGFHASCRAIH